MKYLLFNLYCFQYYIVVHYIKSIKKCLHNLYIEEFKECVFKIYNFTVIYLYKLYFCFMHH